MLPTFDLIQKRIEFEEEKKAEGSVMVQYLRSIFSYASSYFVSEAVNFGRLNAVEYIDGIQIAAAQWSAILDERTCDYCSNYDERIIFVDNPLYAVQQPPAHGNCRCIYIYITAEEVGVEETWPEPSIDEIAQYKLYNIETEEGQDYFAQYFGDRAVRNAMKFASVTEYAEEVWDIEGSPF